MTRLTDGAEAVGEIFATINQDRGQAAAKTLAYLAKGGSTAHLFDAARRMIFHKGTDSHDYKYGAAIWEECLAASDPRWRARWPPRRCSISPAPRPATAR